MERFITETFLLNTESARRLYFEYAQNEPIIDYHCHLSPREVAEDRRFENMTQIWLGGDHYKWRALRAAGVDERYITGNASDWEKFERWAEIVPLTIRNPLFHWTALELNRPFGINDRFLNKSTAESIWRECNSKLAEPATMRPARSRSAFCRRSALIKSFRVRARRRKGSFPICNT